MRLSQPTRLTAVAVPGLLALAVVIGVLRADPAPTPRVEAAADVPPITSTAPQVVREPTPTPAPTTRAPASVAATAAPQETRTAAPEAPATRRPTDPATSAPGPSPTPTPTQPPGLLDLLFGQG